MSEDGTQEVLIVYSDAVIARIDGVAMAALLQVRRSAPCADPSRDAARAVPATRAVTRRGAPRHGLPAPRGGGAHHGQPARAPRGRGAIARAKRRRGTSPARAAAAAAALIAYEVRAGRAGGRGEGG
jgi:hypothetical protein